MSLLEIKGLKAGIETGEILGGIDLNVDAGSIHVIMGPNGAGKSTLGNVIMGSPAYSVTDGSIIFDGEDIMKMAANERAKKGLFMSFQNALEVPGLTLEAFLRSAMRERTGKAVRIFQYKKELEETCRLAGSFPHGTS